MNYLVLIHYEAEIYKRSSEARGGESCIVENLCMVLYVTCIATPLWRHNDSGVTKSTQNMNANMFKCEIIWIVCCVNCVSIDFNEIYVNSNKNSASILWERAFWIIASHRFWYLQKFMTDTTQQFHHCNCEMCEWLNFGTFFKFPCIVRIYAWFFMHCRNHHSNSHAKHVIISN